MKNKTLLTVVALVVVLVISVSVFAVHAIDQAEKDAIIEEKVTEKVDELFDNLADSINKSSGGHGYAASYKNDKLVITASINGASGIVDVITLDKIFDVVASALPIVFGPDEVYFDDLLIYNGSSLDLNGVKSFVYRNIMGLEEFSNLRSKTILDFAITLKIMDVKVTVPVEFKLNITDDQFETLKAYAYRASQYVDISKNDSVYCVRVDATDVYDKLLNEYILEKGYTVKEAREKLNALTLRTLVEKMDEIELTGRLENYNDEYLRVIELAEKLLAKIDNTKYSSYLDIPFGMLDKDNDGVYGDARTVTIPVEKIINKLESYAIQYIPDYNYNLSEIIGVTSINVSYDVQIAVHDSYTATFVDENGNVLYETTILEGETPEYQGRTPEKDADEEFIYTFEGWFDGTTLYTTLPELLEDTTYTAQFASEPNVCKHPNATPVDGVEPDCSNPGMTEGVICPDCGEIVSGCVEIPPTGIHVDADDQWDTDEQGHFHVCACGEIFDFENHDGTATCIKKAVCTVCGVEHGDVDSTKHGDTELRGVVAGNCGVDGYTGDTYCKDCDAKIADGQVIPATGEHSYGDWVTVTEPSTEAHGLKEKTCSVCGHKVEEEIPQITDAPDTGDATVVCSIVAVISIIGMAATVVLKKRKVNN